MFGRIFLIAVAMLGTMEMAMAHDVVLTRTIKAPADRVWKALTEEDQIERWWGPNGFSAPKIAVDLRMGGQTLVCMAAPGFPTTCNTWTFTEINPPQTLAFEQGWADENGKTIEPSELGFLPADIPKVVPHVVRLEALADGTTQLSWSEFGYASAETAAMSRGGLEQVLDKLVAVAELR